MENERVFAMHPNRGFSLVELMVTIIVLGILVALAAPSFETFLTNARLSSVTNELLTDLALARTESARINRRVTVCASANASSCASSSTTDWSSGWIIFSDGNSNFTVDSTNGDEILKVKPALSTGLTLVTSTFPSTGQFQFRPSGAVSNEGRFVLCKSGLTGNYGRRIQVTGSGSIVLTQNQTCS